MARAYRADQSHAERSLAVAGVKTLPLKFRIRVIDGGMAVGLTLTSVPRMQSAAIVAQQVVEELQAQNITYGVDTEVLTELIHSRTLNVEKIVAKGLAPTRGHSAEIELWLFPPTWTEDDAEEPEYHRLETLREVHSGDIIARKTPSVHGIPGRNVFGQVVHPLLPKDTQLPAGQNTVISEDGLELRAAMDGRARWGEGVIDVVDAYIVFGDVNDSTGDVHYPRNVEIYGNVASGHEVLANGDVSVLGHVDRASVTSEEGKVAVKGAAMGGAEVFAHVRGQRNVHVGGARFAKVESRTGSITVDAAVEHSELRAGKDVLLHGGPAVNSFLEVGGSVRIIQQSQPPSDGAPDGAHEVRRASVRVDLLPPIQVQLQRGAHKQKVVADALDISSTGMRLRVAIELEPEERVWVQPRLPEASAMPWIDARILRLIERPSRTLRVYALEFLDLDASVAEAIARFCISEDLRQKRLTRKAPKRPIHWSGMGARY